MFLLRSLSANYYYYLLNLFSKRRCRMQLENLKIHGENLKILKMRSNKSEKLQSLLWRYRFGWDLNPRPTDSLAFTESALIALEPRRAIKVICSWAVYSFNNSTTISIPRKPYNFSPIIICNFFYPFFIYSQLIETFRYFL
jgi:hypothetical protein